MGQEQCSDRRDPLIDKTIGGRYRLLSRVGTGGISSVYLARHVLIDRILAIKTLRRDLHVESRDLIQLRAQPLPRKLVHEDLDALAGMDELDIALVDREDCYDVTRIADLADGCAFDEKGMRIA